MSLARAPSPRGVAIVDNQAVINVVSRLVTPDVYTVVHYQLMYEVNEIQFFNEREKRTSHDWATNAGIVVNICTKSTVQYDGSCKPVETVRPKCTFDQISAQLSMKESSDKRALCISNTIETTNGKGLSSVNVVLVNDEP